MSEEAKKWALDAEKLIGELKRRNMEGYFCATAAEAQEKVLSLIPEGSSVGWGGSVTLSECGLPEALGERKLTLLDRSLCKTPEETAAIYQKMFSADYFLTSTNAITQKGELVNTDGRANRVAMLCYGPEKVIVVAGMNKVVPNVEAGMERIRSIAAPKNALRLNRNTPCAKIGRCADCLSPDCICSQTVVTRFSSVPRRICVILVGESLGF
ncbi:MAG: lactate utilization protein [Clostridia bacterium]|nr:lactate utilization protein [Clostridia bacterium]